MILKRLVVALLFFVMLLGILSVASLAQDDITLTMLTHWGTEDQLAAQQVIIDAYMESNRASTLSWSQSTLASCEPRSSPAAQPASAPMSTISTTSGCLTLSTVASWRNRHKIR